MNNPDERYNEYVSGIYRRAAEARSSFEYRVIKNARSESNGDTSPREAFGTINSPQQGTEPEELDKDASCFR